MQYSVSKRKFKNPLEERVKRLREKMPCKEYALYLVSLRAQGTEQLREKLERKKYTKEEISETINRLTELGYLNDALLAETYFENLLRFKNFGYYGIKKKLMMKKLDDKDISRLLKTLTIKKESEVAERVLKQSSRKNRVQLVRSFQSRGFRLDSFQKLLPPVDY
ncbi:MAG: regulatory protein RecX [Candidatus Doudnabacteria bacterium]